MNPDDVFAASSPEQDILNAGLGDPVACVRVGYRYYTGMAGKVNVPLARAYFSAASSTAVAAAWLAYIDVVAPNKATTMSSVSTPLRQAAASGDPTASTLLGRVVEHGLDGSTPDPQAAAALYGGAAPQFALAKTCLGQTLLRAGDEESAKVLFQGASEAGETKGAVNLALLHLCRGTVPMTPAKAVLRLAAIRGDRRALYQLALCYRDGVPGTPRNAARAIHLLRASATAGYKPAQVALSNAYMTGTGAPVNNAAATFWWNLANRR